MRAWYLLSYVLWIIKEILAGSVQVARGVYSPRTLTSPAIVEYPLRAATDLEIIAMASSITITPGTLVVGTAHGTMQEDPSLFVHVLFAESREQVLADLAEMEERLLRASRGREGAEKALRQRKGGIGDDRFRDTRAARAVFTQGPRTPAGGARHPEDPTPTAPSVEEHEPEAEAPAATSDAGTAAPPDAPAPQTPAPPRHGRRRADTPDPEEQR